MSKKIVSRSRCFTCDKLFEGRGTTKDEADQKLNEALTAHYVSAHQS